MSEKYQLLSSAEAKEDLKDIYRYIAFQFFSPDTTREQWNVYAPLFAR